MEMLLVGAQEAGKLLGISRSQFLALDKAGRLGPECINLGSGVKNQCRRWKTADLQEWVESDCPSRRVWTERKKTLEGIKKRC
jgi:predicted DNA-binding transcriptional regulator AlpA